MFANRLLSQSSYYSYDVAVPPPGHFSFWTIYVFFCPSWCCFYQYHFLNNIVGFLLNAFHYQWSCSVTSESLGSHGLWPTRLLHPWTFPGKSTGVGCNFLLQGIFPTQGLNPGLLHCRLYRLSYQGSPLNALKSLKYNPLSSLVLESRCSEIMLFKVLKLFFFV